MSVRAMFLSIVGLLVLVVLSAILFTVTEGRHALVMRLGQLVSDDDGKAIVYAPGLHVKMPIVEDILMFDTRLLTLDNQSSRVVTGEKKAVIVDYFVKWRIEDLALYYTRTGGQQFKAEKLLQQLVNDGLRAEFGRRTINEVVSDDRSAIMTSLNDRADHGAKELGIRVVDVRIKRIDLPEEVSNAVYDRMRAERERAAKEHRAQGRASAEAIRAKADADATIIVATGRAEANGIRAQGDAEAAKTYADAYNQDKEFYSFYRSLEAYLNTFDSKQDMLLLTPEGQFFKYFDTATGKQASNEKP